MATATFPKSKDLERLETEHAAAQERVRVLRSDIDPLGGTVLSKSARATFEQAQRDLDDITARATSRAAQEREAHIRRTLASTEFKQLVLAKLQADAERLAPLAALDNAIQAIGVASVAAIIRPDAGELFALRRLAAAVRVAGIDLRVLPGPVAEWIERAAPQREGA